MTATTKKRTVKIGDTFRHAYADSNALWRVIRSAGRGVWEAEIVNEPVEIRGTIYDGDYAGVTDVFRTADILNAINLDSFWQDRTNQHEDWWDTVPVGTVIHYCDGFGKFVRGIVGVLDAANSDRDDYFGQKGLIPIALVGNVLEGPTPGKQGWWHYDIKIRRPDGRVDYGYHAKKILSGKGGWRPNATCVYESPLCSTSYKDGPDPREFDPIELSPPKADNPDAEAVVRHYADVFKTLEGDGYPHTATEALDRLCAAHELIHGGPDLGEDDE